MILSFYTEKKIEVTKLFVINYTILTPTHSSLYLFSGFYHKLKSKNKSNTFLKFDKIYIINQIQLNQNYTKLTSNPIFKISCQKILSANTKNPHLKYLNKEELFSYFDSNNKLRIITIKNISLK